MKIICSNRVPAFNSLSCSALKCYESCPGKFKLEYIDRLGAAFRTNKPHLSYAKSIHSALAVFFRKSRRINDGNDEIRSILLSNWQKAGYRDAAEEAVFFNRAIESLTGFIQTGGTGARPLALEDFFKINVGGFAVTGRIDRVDSAGADGLEVIDYKTGKYLPSSSEIPEDLQLMTYALAAREKYGRIPAAVTLCLLEHGLRMSYKPSAADMEKTSERIKTLFMKISSDGEFAPVINRFCGACDYLPVCKAPGRGDFSGFSRALADLAGSRLGTQEIASRSLHRMMELTHSVKGLFSEVLENGILSPVYSAGFPCDFEAGAKHDFAEKGIYLKEGEVFVPLFFENVPVGLAVLSGRPSESLSQIETAMLESLSLQTAAMLNNVRLRKQSRTDMLTRLYNRGYFEERFTEEMDAAVKNAGPLSLVMFDVDFFKKINDAHGHTAGDSVLAGVAGIIGRHAGQGGIAARYGGEEFACLMPGRRLTDAAALGERVRAEVAGTGFNVKGSRITVTVSAGAAEFAGGVPSMPADPRDIIDCADKNLYAAKNSGRNKVVF